MAADSGATDICAQTPRLSVRRLAVTRRRVPVVSKIRLPCFGFVHIIASLISGKIGKLVTADGSGVNLFGTRFRGALKDGAAIGIRDLP